MFCPRSLSKRLLALVEHFPVVVISGARQVGKSTLLRHHFGDTAGFVVFDPVVDVAAAREDPELFLDNHPTPLVLDEIQYAPEVLPALKRRIDNDRSPGQYLITGSQQWGVLKNISESLAGRAVFLDLEGFTVAEAVGAGDSEPWLHRYLEDPHGFLNMGLRRLQTEHTLYEQLYRGFLPEAQRLPVELLADFQSAYMRTYIERDVRQLAEVGDWQRFGRFVRLVSALTAQEINFSQLGREIDVAPATARVWLSLLQATFQWFELPPFTRNAVKRISGRSKGYIADTGMACAAQVIPSPTAIASHPLKGALFETAVVSELRKLSSLMSPRPNLYHWRTHSGAEVDVLIEYNGVIHPIEIKSKSRPGRRDLSGIVAFRKTYPTLNIGPGLVLAPAQGPTQLTQDDWVIPWDVA